MDNIPELVQVKPPEVKVDADAQLLLDIEKIHRLYKIHDFMNKHTLKGTDDGNGGIDVEETENSITYSTQLCPDCKMPIYNHGGTKWANTLEATNEFLTWEGKFKNPATYVTLMRERIEDWTKNPSTRRCCNHIPVDKMMHQYAKHIDHAKIYKVLCNACEGKYDKESNYSVNNALTNKMLYEEHFLGGIKEETKAYALSCIRNENGKGDFSRDSDAEIAEMYIAFAIKHKWPIDRKLASVLLRKAKNLQFKQELTVYTGKFRKSAIRCLYLRDALASYEYVKKYAPELLQDADWFAKKFRFDRDDHDMLALKYFNDTGKGIKQMAEHGRNYILSAIAYHLPDKHPNAKKYITTWLGSAIGGDGNIAYVFGTQEVRRKNYMVDNEYLHITLCDNIDQVMERWKANLMIMIKKIWAML